VVNFKGLVILFLVSFLGSCNSYYSDLTFKIPFHSENSIISEDAWTSVPGLCPILFIPTKQSFNIMCKKEMYVFIHSSKWKYHQRTWHAKCWALLALTHN